jgi:phage gp46-like protein
VPVEFDIGVTGQTLDTSETLATAVTCSLLTYARARPDDPVQDGTDLRGWWGDTYSEIPGDSFGSRLWLLWGRHMSEALELAEPIVRDALQWMIEDGLASRIDVTLEAVTPQMLGIKIGIVQPGQKLVQWLGTWEASLRA